jgi:serine/threonine protein kinase
MSPELLSGSTCYDGLVDVYAYGILLYEIMCFEPPFADLDLEDVEAAVLAGKRPEIDPEAMPDDLAQLAQACWSQEASDRPTFTAVVSALEKLRPEALWTAVPEEASSADQGLSSHPDFY